MIIRAVTLITLCIFTLSCHDDFCAVNINGHTLYLGKKLADFKDDISYKPYSGFKYLGSEECIYLILEDQVSSVGDDNASIGDYYNENVSGLKVNAPKAVINGNMYQLDTATHLEQKLFEKNEVIIIVNNQCMLILKKSNFQKDKINFLIKALPNSCD